MTAAPGVPAQLSELSGLLDNLSRRPTDGSAGSGGTARPAAEGVNCREPPIPTPVDSVDTVGLFDRYQEATAAVFQWAAPGAASSPATLPHFSDAMGANAGDDDLRSWAATDVESAGAALRSPVRRRGTALAPVAVRSRSPRATSPRALSPRQPPSTQSPRQQTAPAEAWGTTEDDGLWV